MTAFDPTPLRPDAPAMPMHSHDADDWNTPVPYITGLTARQHAAIALCVPDSGVDWLNAMIEQRRRDEFAQAALKGVMASGRAEASIGWGIVIFKAAEAMLLASKKEQGNG